jgi:glycosyltransferase involved in cell wall biosynthesis
MLSLITPTLNRTAEPERLLTSLDSQSYQDFEVLLVDQNSDDRLAALLQRYSRLKVRRLRSDRGLSLGRNVGIRASRGEIIAFPDDDCWYPRELLAAVTNWFEVHPEFDALFTSGRTEDDRIMASKWGPGACRCTIKNVWHCTISFTAFIRRRVIDAVGFFDENIGVGSPSRYQSGEEMDYFIRILKLGFRMWHDPSLVVYHPELQSLERFQRIAQSYSLGVGYVLRIHGYSWWYLSEFLARSLGGAVISLGKGDSARARAYIQRAAGHLQGYMFGPRELERLSGSSTQTKSSI